MKVKPIVCGEKELRHLINYEDFYFLSRVCLLLYSILDFRPLWVVETGEQS